MKLGPYNDAMAGRPPSSEAPPLGKKLAALRKQRGLTQQQLADALGQSQSVVVYYERRAVNPSLELLQKLATFYGVAVTELVADAAPTPKPTPRRHGPPSAFEARWERVRRLPRRKQAELLEMLDDAIARAERRAT